MWFSVVCTLINNDMHHHSGQNLLWTHSAAPHESTVMTRIIVDTSSDRAKPHLDFVFLPQYQRQKKMFFSEHELKKALHDTLTRAALSGLLSTTAN